MTNQQQNIKTIHSQINNSEYNLTICTKNRFSAYIKKHGDFTPIRISDHCTGVNRASEEVQFSIFQTEKTLTEKINETIKCWENPDYALKVYENKIQKMKDFIEKMGKTQSFNDTCKGKLSRKKEIYQYEFFLLQNFQPFTKSKRKFY